MQIKRAPEGQTVAESSANQQAA